MPASEKGKQDVRNLLGMHLNEYDGAHPFAGVEDKFTQTTAAVQAAADEHKAGRISREEAEARSIQALDDECNELFGEMTDQGSEASTDFDRILNTLFSR